MFFYLAAWVNDLNPFIWRISGDFGIRWYGASYIAGFLCAWLILRLLSKRGACLIPAERLPDAMLAIMLGVLVGGRLGYVLLYQPALLWDVSATAPWWGVLAINRGGMASHGGMVGIVLAAAWIARMSRAPTLHVLDMMALTAPVGLFFGRIANFINGELLGRIVAAPGEPGPWWSVRFPQELLTRHAPKLTWEQEGRLLDLLARAAPREVATHPDKPEEAIRTLIRRIQLGSSNLRDDLAPLLAARHPSQLYQAFAEGLVLLIVLWLIWTKPRRPGVVGGWFLILYGVMRIATEHFRLPDDHLKTPLILGLSRGQWLSAAMVIAGAVVLAVVVRGKETARVGGWLRRG